MGNDYKIKLEVRGRTVDFGADSATELFMFLSIELYRMDKITEPSNAPNNTDMAAKRLIEQYCQRFVDMNTNRSHSPMYRAGLEVELAKCYLERMSISQAVNWLKKEKNFKTSDTAVGRYWGRFARLKAASKTA